MAKDAAKNDSGGSTMNALFLMAALIYLQVSGPVSTLQCDLETTGTAQIAATLTTKQLSSNRLPNGKLRIIVSGLNQATFSGTFAIVDAPVVSIAGVVTANPNGTASTATVSAVPPVMPQRLPAPKNVQVK